jgi:hypothetical protein
MQTVRDVTFQLFRGLVSRVLDEDLSGRSRHIL